MRHENAEQDLCFRLSNIGNGTHWGTWRKLSKCYYARNYGDQGHAETGPLCHQLELWLFILGSYLLDQRDVHRHMLKP